jgi:2-oxoglutarate dehydrogenase E2 component (dihydrolipoamide succinyltransferase)
MRSSIAAHMVQSMAVAPHVTAVFEADLTAVLRHREANQKAYTSPPISCRPASPRSGSAQVNSRWRDGARDLSACNIGVATALPGRAHRAGGATPKADDGGHLAPAQRFTARARAGTLEPKEVRGHLPFQSWRERLASRRADRHQPAAVRHLGVGRLEQRVR